MKHFINQRDDIVAEAVDGLILASGGRLVRLDGYPTIRVVLRRERPADRVAVLSGGGAGHEPGHAGYVGDGMLDAAVCGDVFASPTVDAVLAAILAVTGPAGCLLIVKNYVGDRLNFGLAAERARGLGLRVETVVVGDDVAIADAPRPRGVAGTVLVHKAAGYAAAKGWPLERVRAVAEDVAGAVRTLGVATATCSIPGRPSEARLKPGEAELGLGIHGEPGFERVALASVRDLVATMTARLEAKVDGEARLAVLINNLGATPGLEMAIVTREVLASRLGRRIDLVLGPAPAVTALDMRGFSLSLLPLDAARRDMLQAPVDVAAWPVARPVAARGAVPVRPLPGRLDGTPAEPSDDAAVRACLSVVCATVIAAREDLDALDARIGDGDTGSTFARAAQRILDDLDRLPLAEPDRLCRAIAERLSRVMGGSSGVLLSIFAAAAGTAFAAGAPVDAALRAGLARMQHYGGAAEGDRTMIDALLPAIRTLEAGQPLASAARAARRAADATAALAVARAGRSSYLASRDLQGVIDPGAEAVARIFEALAAVAVAAPAVV
jgi:dihydroxyacetone kinase